MKYKYNTLREKHEALEKQKQQIEAQISLLQSECDHEHIKDNYGTGHCPDCGFKTKGWLCVSSPTKECDYYDPNVDEYDEYDDDESCIYCGHPEERK